MLSSSSLQRLKHVIPSDGNNAAAYVGYAFTETAFGFPITPSTQAFEAVEEWAHGRQKKNAFGHVPTVVMMQAEGGVAGAMHGAAVTGSLSTTFTSSQGLMLMYPNLFKLKNSKTPPVFHVASRSLAATNGSIECDHSDVMAVRASGLGMLTSASNQDVHDLAVVAHLSAIRGKVPFLHWYDGFRTSHQITKVELLDYDEFATLIPKKELMEYRESAVNPTHPSQRMVCTDGSFGMQFDLAAGCGHANLAKVVDESMDKLSKLTGRRLHLFDYYGHPKAKSVIIMMGSNSQNVQEAVDYLNARGEKYGIITVRLFRPFSLEHLLDAIPRSCEVITALDRVKENGSLSQPLHSDVATALGGIGSRIRVLGGVYGLGGRELTPSQAGVVFANSTKVKPQNWFTVGVKDDVTNTSLPVPPEVDMVPPKTRQCIFWGLGADGTVGANKEAIAIICGQTPQYGQGFFTYDAKKSGGITRSHLRFGPEPIRANYEIQKADYVAVHASRFTQLYSCGDRLKENGTFVFNCNAKNATELEKFFTPYLRRQLADKKAKLFIIDATKIAAESGLPGRINMIMQAVFFNLSNILPVDQAIKLLKESVHKNYGHQGEKIVNANITAIDKAVAGLIEIKIPDSWKQCSNEFVSRFANIKAPEVVKRSLVPLMELQGDKLKPSDLVDISAYVKKEGMGSSKYEKRGIATQIPIWDSKKCIQCNTCSFVCAHACIRPALFDKSKYGKNLTSIKAKKLKGFDFLIDVSPYDCLGCGVCVQKCPTKALAYKRTSDELFEKIEKTHLEVQGMPPTEDLIETVPEAKKLLDKKFSPDGSQYFTPLLEYSGACGGCHETLYAKLLTQLYGPRLMVVNATGCSIVWSSSLPSLPWTSNNKGYGPTWTNSLFEDNAEYGLGQYWAFTHRREQLLAHVIELLAKERNLVDPAIVSQLEKWVVEFDNGDQCQPIAETLMDMFRKTKGTYPEESNAEYVSNNSDLFIKPAVWIVGGDGWANDIDYGGLDHVVATDPDLNILVYDNESYANTGFQMSKATPRSALMKFASAGKSTPKKDLAFMMLNYPNAYVASISIGANAAHTVKAIKEAENHHGASFLVGYCPCIGHGIRPSMENGHIESQYANDSGYWPLFRRNPDTKKLTIDSKPPNKELLPKMLGNEVRYESMRRFDAERMKRLQTLLSEDIDARWAKLKHWASAAQ